MNNIAPSAGVAWRIPVKSDSFWSKLLSQDPVLRGGYTRAYTREGLTNDLGHLCGQPWR